MKKRILLITATALLFVAKPVKAETVTAIATAYCLDGTTATGTHTQEGRTIAGKREWFNKVLVVHEDTDGSGRILPENYIGTFICEDIGGESIQNGYVVDVFIKDYKQAKQFGSKKVIIQVIDSEG